MQKSPKRNNNSRVSGIKLNSVDAEKEKRESQNNFVELLPPEVTFKIFSQLDMQSLCRASITCRSWNYTVKNSDSLWKPHCLTLRAVCQREVDNDLKSGYSWRVSLVFEVCGVLHNMVIVWVNSAFCREEVGFHIRSVLAFGLEVELIFLSYKPHHPIHPFTFFKY